jgi:hypothetical protein
VGLAGPPCSSTISMKTGCKMADNGRNSQGEETWGKRSPQNFQFLELLLQISASCSGEPDTLLGRSIVRGAQGAHSGASMSLLPSPSGAGRSVLFVRR